MSERDRRKKIAEIEMVLVPWPAASAVASCRSSFGGPPDSLVAAAFAATDPKLYYDASSEKSEEPVE